jgi:uncharacterized membrane protein
VDSAPFPDEHNPYAAPEAALTPERPAIGVDGDLREAPISGPNPHARIRLDAIRDAWQLFSDRAGTWILIFLTYGATIYGTSMALAILNTFLVRVVGPNAQNDSLHSGVMVVLIQVVAQLVNNALLALLVGGLFQTAIKQVRGLPIGVGDLFKASGLRTWQTMFVVRLIVGLATFGSAILLILPGLFFSARLMFAQPLVADGKLSTFEAIGMSWKATRGQWAIGMLFIVAMYFTSVLGAIGLGIGILVTLPVWPLSIAVLYRDFFLSHIVSPQGSPWIADEPEVLEEL